MKEYDLNERQQTICKLISENGKVRVAELKDLFSTSEVTIRKDLEELEATGILERVHGGAISPSKDYFNLSFHQRKSKNMKEKIDIAKAAARTVNDSDTLFINSGTTTYFLAEELRNKKKLSVVTNSIWIANELSNIPEIKVILLGGYYNSTYGFTYGDDAVNKIKSYHTDKCFLSVDGITPESVSTYHYEEAEVSRAMIERSNQRIVLADYSKIGKESFTTIKPLAEIDLIVTNEITIEENKNWLSEIKTEVRYT